MSKITIERNHSLPLTIAIEKANQIGEELRQEFGLQADWRSDTVAVVSGKGVTGTMVISDTKVVIEMKLGFALRLFSTKIKKGVAQRLEDTLRA